MHLGEPQAPRAHHGPQAQASHRVPRAAVQDARGHRAIASQEQGKGASGDRRAGRGDAQDGAQPRGAKRRQAEAGGKAIGREASARRAPRYHCQRRVAISDQVGRGCHHWGASPPARGAQAVVFPDERRCGAGRPGPEHREAGGVSPGEDAEHRVPGVLERWLRRVWATGMAQRGRAVGLG
eukprot:GHVL01003546.1.p6 GENE.GHVL01003546.1~~GHVL01003546.1.p6  ORF type:complete len:181 (-),score=21.55 GHVL01003546.1:27-569(-)